MRVRITFVLLVAAGWLTGCGGGGGGNSPVMPVPPIPFTSFSAVKSGQPVQASGISQTINAQTTSSSVVTSTSVNPVDTANSGATLTYGAIPTMTAFSLSAPGSSVSYSSVQCSAGVCQGQNNTSVGGVINALDPAVAWNYQTFGTWLANGPGNSGTAGTISFGNPTPVAGVPVSGNATYTGLSSGTYVDQTGAVFTHGAQMSSKVNFGDRTIAFSTSNSTTVNISSGAVAAAPALDLTGQLTYAPMSNQFSGPVSAPLTTLTGTATGQFYGPTAQEMGGVYALKSPGTGPQTMLGGFGGKRP